MKNYIITLLMLLLLHPLLAQRSSNQNLFKQRSRSQYNISDKTYDYNGLQNQNTLGRTAQGSNQIIFKAQALMNVKADRYLAVFNLTQVGKTAPETNRLINQRIDGFLTDLRDLSVEQEDTYTDMIYLIPTFEFEVQKKLFSSDTYVEVPTGFEMQKNVHISLKP